MQIKIQSRSHAIRSMRWLDAAGWQVQSKKNVNFSAAQGVAVREYDTDAGPADYVLFVDRKPVGVIEAKREEEGHRLTVVEEQSAGYATAKLKYLNSCPASAEGRGFLAQQRVAKNPPQKMGNVL